MPRTKKRKNRSFSEEEVHRALRMLEGSSFRKVGQSTGIQIWTLHLYKTKHLEKKKILVAKRGKPTTLSAKQEKRLVTVMKNIAELFF
jgi:transposase